jgi:hypothetical protein
MGCQSHAEGVRVACDAPKDCGQECTDASPDMRTTILARHVEDNLSNGEGIQLMNKLAQLPPQEQANLMRSEAKKVGLETCQLADVFEANATEDIADEPVEAP